MPYLIIDREAFSDDLWLNEPFTRGQAFHDLLYLANYKEGHLLIRGNMVPVARGQVGWSQNRLAERWEWSRGKVDRFLVQLQKMGKIEQQKSKLTSLITIINYANYQSKQTTDDTTDEQQTIQQTDPIVVKKTKGSKLGATKTKRGTRLPNDWSLPDKWRQWALENKPGINCEAEAEKFRDYWISKPGQQAVKLDWLATWRNWVRNSKGGNYGAATGSRGKTSAVDRVRQANSQQDYQQGSIIDITPEVG